MMTKNEIKETLKNYPVTFFDYGDHHLGIAHEKYRIHSIAYTEITKDVFSEIQWLQLIKDHRTEVDKFQRKINLLNEVIEGLKRTKP